jgi:hypothetical protein
MPRPDFPRNLAEFLDLVPTDRAAFEYVVASRWPHGFRCPKCGGDGFARTDRLAMQCRTRTCQTLTSATAGTAMHRSKVSIRKWLQAAWLVVTDKRGISSVQLANQLGVHQETAYMMLHKLRAAMVAPERTMLRGVVEADESFINTIPAKPLVAGAVEVRSGKNKSGKPVTYLGRIRLRHVGSRDAEDLMRFLIENVEDGSTVVTDALATYTGGNVELGGFKHRVESTARGMRTEDVLRHYHLVISNLKTYLAGTYHGAVEMKHLQAYLNEYVYRFNRRGNLPAAFQTLLGIAGSVEGPEYAEIYAPASSAEAWVHPNPRRDTERAPLLARQLKRRRR